jgi:hypothetical protein
MLSTDEPADASALAAALVSFDQAVQTLIDQDPDRHGRFSRAYVTAIFRACLLPPEPGAGAPRGRPDPEIAQALKQWIQAQLLRHPGEGDDHRLTAARRAAHGFWLQSMACPIDDDGQPRAARLLEGLLALTHPE